MSAPARLAERDELDPRLRDAMWLLPFIPLVGWPLLVWGSSVLYFAWRRRLPERAQALNRQAWRAGAVGLAVNVVGALLLVLLQRIDALK
jgi:hypothetical protein